MIDFFDDFLSGDKWLSDSGDVIQMIFEVRERLRTDFEAMTNEERRLLGLSKKCFYG